MASKFDIVFGNGCSFVQGSEINGEPLPSEPVLLNPGRFTDVVAKHFNAQEFNIAAGGAGNDKLFRTTFDWINKNRDTCSSKKILFCLGLTFPQRTEAYCNSIGEYTKFNIYSNGNIAERISQNSKYLTKKELHQYAEIYLAEFFNEERRIEEHFRLITALLAYIKQEAPLSEVFIFNSLYNEYPDWFRDGLNLDKEYAPSWESYIGINNLSREEGGHPSKETHLELANYIIEKYGR